MKQTSSCPSPPGVCSLPQCWKSWSMQSRSWYQLTCLTAYFFTPFCLLTFFLSGETPWACRVGHPFTFQPCIVLHCIASPSPPQFASCLRPGACTVPQCWTSMEHSRYQWCAFLHILYSYLLYLLFSYVVALFYQKVLEHMQRGLSYQEQGISKKKTTSFFSCLCNSFPYPGLLRFTKSWVRSHPLGSTEFSVGPCNSVPPF